jgi:hypothetical protein
MMDAKEIIKAISTNVLRMDINGLPYLSWEREPTLLPRRVRFLLFWGSLVRVGL